MTHPAPHAPVLEYAAVVLIVLALLSILNPVRWVDAIYSNLASSVARMP